MNPTLIIILVGAAAVVAYGLKKKPINGNAGRIADLRAEMSQALADNNTELYEILRLEIESIEEGVL